MAKRSFRWLIGQSVGEAFTVTDEGSFRGEYRIAGSPGAWLTPADVRGWLDYGVVEEVACG